MLFLLILYIGNKASLAIRHEIIWSLQMRYCGVPLYARGQNMLLLFLFVIVVAVVVVHVVVLTHGTLISNNYF